jgi:hypothetical protein
MHHGAEALRGNRLAGRSGPPPMTYPPYVTRRPPASIRTTRTRWPTRHPASGIHRLTCYLSSLTSRQAARLQMRMATKGSGIDLRSFKDRLRIRDDLFTERPIKPNALRSAPLRNGVDATGPDGPQLRIGVADGEALAVTVLAVQVLKEVPLFDGWRPAQLAVPEDGLPQVVRPVLRIVPEYFEHYS